MRVVIYTRDFEPITVIELPLWAFEQAEKRGRVALLLMPPWVQWAEAPSDEIMMPNPRMCSLYAERLRWLDGKIKHVLIAEDDELALALTPSWLPGQQGMVSRYQATINGLMMALTRQVRP